MGFRELPRHEVGSVAWHELRRTQGVGASEAAAVLGMSPFQTAVDVYAAKYGQQAEIPAHFAYWGNNLEDAVAKWVTDTHPEMGDVMGGLTAYWNEHPHIYASLDRVLDQGELIPLEIKTGSLRSRDDHWTVDGRIQVPAYYQVQVQQQMAVIGAPRAYVAVLFGGNDAHLLRVERDDEFIESVLVPRLTAFWEGVQNGVPPEPTTMSDLAYAYPHEPGETTVGSELVVEAVERRAVILSDIKAMQEEADRLTFEIGKYMGSAETLLDPDGNPLVTFKLQAGRESVSVSELRAQFPDVAAQMVKQGKPFKVMRQARRGGNNE